MTDHELQQRIQSLEWRNKNLSSQQRKLKIQLASRDKRIKALYQSLHDNNIPIPQIKESQNFKKLMDRGKVGDYDDVENLLESIADDHYNGSPNQGTINFGYERGRHDGFKEAIREFAI